MPEQPSKPPRRAQRIHELGLKLIALIVLAAAAFGLTDALAASLRQITLRDAGTLYAAGSADLAHGDIADAVEALRGASRKNRDSVSYALQYARALAAARQPDTATRTLLLLRDRVPDNAEVNLELARLAAGQNDLETGVRYYRYALYAPWPDAGGPRRTRRELIILLLDHGERNRALSELIAAQANSENTAPAHIDLGRLFVRAGEPALALEEFRRALTLAPDDTLASRLAGETAFNLADYRAATRYLEGASPDDDTAAGMRETALAVLRSDPLASRIPAAERLSRLQQLMAGAEDRAAACGIPPTDPSLAQLAMTAPAVRRSAGRDTEVLERGFDAAYAVMQRVANCPTLTPDNRALLIIGARHQEPGR